MEKPEALQMQALRLWILRTVLDTSLRSGAAPSRRTNVFAGGETLGGGGIHCAAVGGFAALRMRRTPCGCLLRAFQSWSGGAAPGGGTQKERHAAGVSLFLEHRSPTDAKKKRGPAQRGGAFAPHKRFRRRRKPWRRANSFCPSISITEGRSPKRKTRRWRVFLFGGGGGS